MCSIAPQNFDSQVALDLVEGANATTTLIFSAEQENLFESSSSMTVSINYQVNGLHGVEPVLNAKREFEY